MSETTRDAESPIWGRVAAFPEAPDGYGWLDAKGKRHELASLDELKQKLSSDLKAQVFLVWTPEQSRMVLPDALDAVSEVVAEGRIKRLKNDDARSRGMLIVMALWPIVGAVLILIQAWPSLPERLTVTEKLLAVVQELMASTSMGVGLLMFVIFGFIPWYQTKKRVQELKEEQDSESVQTLLRFETWLELQRAPLTKALAGWIGLVALVQLLPGDSIMAAGLVKPAYFQGEWWRLFTAPLLHGNLVHFIMNVSALLYLGKRLEVFAGWPHLFMVFVFSAVAGGVMSARFLEATTVGASGGLMGWLGFLLVFESLHSLLVPRSAKRRLLAGVLLTAVIGVLGYRFIDNAAHAGGLLAGMLYAVVVFPSSASVNRPAITRRDWVAGSAAALVLLGSGLTAILCMLRA